MTKDVSTPSLDYDAMKPFWDKVDAMLGGADTMRQAKQYLPKFPHESDDDYAFRLSTAKFTNVFGDVLENLAAKPFSEEIKVDDDTEKAMGPIIEDIDGNGNHLHVFASSTFYRGIAYGYDWIFVDHTAVKDNLSNRAQEKAAGIRPYWVGLSAADVLSVETARIKGKDEVVHLRFSANTVERDGYEEKTIERIREFNRTKLENGDYSAPVYIVWEKKQNKDNKTEWVSIGEGVMSISIIPLVPFISGRKRGQSLVVRPILGAATDLQLVLYKNESGLEYAKELTAFPILAGNGVEPPMGQDGKPAAVPVGPKAVLYAPPGGEGNHGEWSFVEPAATSLNFLKDDIQATIEQIRELGKQPMTQGTGNLTSIMAAQSASKGNSAVKSAALLLKDSLENALKITAEWLKIDVNPEVAIFTDFEIDLTGNEDLDTLKSMREGGDISQDTYWLELKRRNTLSANFNSDDEKDRLDEELPSEDSGQDIVDASLTAAKVDSDAV